MVQQKCNFSQVLDSITTKYKAKDQGYTLCLPAMRTVLGDINGGKYIVVSGRQSSGKTSFVDQCYVVNPLMQWYYTRDMSEHKLKIFYFSLKSSPVNKLKSLLVNYIKERHNVTLDIAILDSEAGARMFLEDTPDMYKFIPQSSEFFDHVLEHALTIIPSCTSINQFVSKTIELLDENEIYDNIEKVMIHHPGVTTKVIVVIDDIEFLRMGDKSSTWELEFNQACIYLKDEFAIDVVAILPSLRTNLLSNPELSVPSYKDLGVYSRACDKGIILYNPHQEGFTKTFRNADVNAYITPNGTNFLRYIYVVRNTNGSENIVKRCLFLPQTSMFSELDKDVVINKYDDALEILSKSGKYFIKEDEQ